MNCRHCAAPLSLPMIDLGSSPASNSYLTRDALAAPETWYPLRVLVCTVCWLAQTEDFAARDAFFSEDYAYFSSFSSSWLHHSKSYVEEMVARYGLRAESLAIEVASNDGYLLQYMREAGIRTLGIEPTRSTAQAARAKGIDTVEEFFGVALAKRLVAEGRSADLTTANNVLAHVPDINDFVRGFAILLQPGGVATFEFPHLARLLSETQFDTVYHEHYSYLSLTAVDRIFAANGLTVFDVEELPTHGGSLRVFAQRADTGKRVVTDRPAAVRRAEDAAGMRSPDPYLALQPRAETIAAEFAAFLLDARARRKRVAGYGAAAKGNTLLNFAGIRPHLLPWVVDRNPAKAGKYLPGTRIPVVDEARIRTERPDYIVVLPWNLSDEIAQQLAYVRAWGGKFVRAVPQLTIS
jgi:SAM-dependent methyltransferase